jgi:hypothetical protein
MGEEEHNVSVKNISINGLLVQLNSIRDDVDIKYIFNHLRVSTMIDIYLPEMRLAGEVQIVRADMEGDHILLALEFRNMAFEIDERLNRRKAYRKNMSNVGKILLKEHYIEFTTVNVSLEGLMIQILEPVVVEEGIATNFQCKQFELEGKVEVIWVDAGSKEETLIGLKYIHLEKNTLKLPRFAT